MSRVHFLNVKEGDCNIIEHNSGRISVIDVCNARKKENIISNESVDMFSSVRGNFKQKETPENPITYIHDNIKTKEIFRFILTHPDMDHMDGIKDFFDEFSIINFWDTNNNKNINDFSNGKYRQEDWDFYQKLRKRKCNLNTGIRRYCAGNSYQYFDEDKITILSPSEEMCKEICENENPNYNNLSYVLLYQECGKKILFGGDAEDEAWGLIAKNYKKEISNVDVLVASHHGRKTGGSTKYLSILKPKLVLIGNAESEYLNYCQLYDHFTNNQAGNIVLDINCDDINVYCSNGNFAQSYVNKNNTFTYFDDDLNGWFLKTI